MTYQGTEPLALVGVFVVVLLAVLYFDGSRAQLPPGPPRLPIVGNLKYLTVLGRPKPWHLFHKFAQEYGPLTYLELLGKPVVVISNAETAKELLVRRASNVSRPRMIVGNEYVSRNLNFIVSDGDIWRRMRRASEAQLGVKSLIKFEDIQTDEGILFAYDMWMRPEKRQENILRVTASAILSVLYDQPPLQSLDNPTVRLMDEYAHRMRTAVQPGANLVEAMPILDYLPTFLAPWKQNANKDFQIFSSMFLEKFEAVKNIGTLSGEQRPSLCAKLVESGPRHELNDLESAWAAALIYGAAYETTSASLAWFLLIMIQFPHIQQKAQEEIDTVIGRSRMPSFSDMNHLPYIRALMREILRWRPPAPFGVIYQSVKDDYFDGKMIPGGSVCIPNIWSINRDPEVYGADAHAFRPERHLSSDGKLKDEKDEGHFSFGFGRRECVGKYYANKALFIDITMILWGMSIRPAPNGSGQIVIPSISEDVGEGFVAFPPPFECKCEPRFEGAEATLKQARDAVLSAHGGC
ncbi:hypothetical protein D9758_008288 [Tetrapyrgos nigripes]|uniref:Cytochrome P450 n=1 Tax=Tetrapyrgos nigripes TaxID=182062 RepID=A0A8H5LGP8_9AGAR|nr:hypothetical protein D9758_008288 [Tetrapyrgos nigripes]